MIIKKKQNKKQNQKKRPRWVKANQDPTAILETALEKNYTWPRKLHTEEIANYIESYASPQSQDMLEYYYLWTIGAVISDNPEKALLDKKMRFLRHKKKSKLPVAFFQPWKKIKLSPTPKQLFVSQKYARYKQLPIKDRIDFFRTYMGQMMLATELFSQPDLEDTWFDNYAIDKIRRSVLNKAADWREENMDASFEENEYWDETMKLDRTLRSILQTNQSWSTHYFWSQLVKKIWWYENLVQKKQKPKSAKKFVLHRPQTAFQIHWKQQQKEPWKNALLFRRAVYSGFGRRFRKENKFGKLKIKPYLRRKNPRSEKRNQLYKRSSLLLANFRQRYRINAKKAARIKEIASKIVWPFYGNLRKKQMRVLRVKNQRLKSKILTKSENLLSHLENRLDVVVYRLNLAPTILWARRLIESGAVFVISAEKTMFWESMYAPLKKIAFPLKLRDPKNLYATTLSKRPGRYSWANPKDPKKIQKTTQKKEQRKASKKSNSPLHVWWTKREQQDEVWSRFKFLNRPQRKISYLLQENDVIQCASANSTSQFKTLSSLWAKPLPKHLLTKKFVPLRWQRRFNKFTSQSFANWEQRTEPFNAAVFLHTPQFSDLNSNDRITESFFRWACM